jgi:hypothetical protein
MTLQQLNASRAIGTMNTAEMSIALARKPTARESRTPGAHAPWWRKKADSRPLAAPEVDAGKTTNG